MKRTDALKELNRLHSGQKVIYAKAIQLGTMKRETARLRLSRLNAAIAVIDAMKDDEFNDFLDRLIITDTDEPKQGELF